MSALPAPRRAREALCLLLLGGAAATAPAAGGHFDVDDAAVLDPGRCQVELWATRARGLATTHHAGAGCRVGPVELGLNLDRLGGGESHGTRAGPQLKWVSAPLATGLNAGLAVAAGFDPVHGGRPATTLYLPVTWVVNGAWALNLNLGRDREPAGPATGRHGLSAEWAPHERLTVIGERVKFGGAWTSRLGARVALGAATSLDLSAARTGPAPGRVFAIGLNHEFAR